MPASTPVCVKGGVQVDQYGVEGDPGAERANGILQRPARPLQQIDLPKRRDEPAFLGVAVEAALDPLLR